MSDGSAKLQSAFGMTLAASVRRDFTSIPIGGIALVPIISLFTVIVLSMLLVRIATVALTLTGISRPLARFQARSAFTGAGFTTGESEKVVGHPVRRRIIMMLMLLGNAGIITAASTLILSFVNLPSDGGLMGSLWFRIVALITGLLLLWMVAHSRLVDRNVSKLIERALKRWTDLEVRDYAGLLRLAGEYGVVEMQVQAEDWLSRRLLCDLKLSDEGVLVLGVERPDGSFVGAPRGKTQLQPGDTVIMYGRQSVLANLDDRRADISGNWEHHKAVEQQKQVLIEEIEEAQQGSFTDDHKQENQNEFDDEPQLSGDDRDRSRSVADKAGFRSEPGSASTAAAGTEHTESR